MTGIAQSTYCLTQQEVQSLSAVLASVLGQSTVGSHTVLYDEILRIISAPDGDGPKEGVTKSSWLWIKGAREVNIGSGATNGYIFGYTEEQSIQRGQGDWQLLQSVSNEIIETLANDMLNPNNNFLVPDIYQIGLRDAGAVSARIFSGDWAGWAGTLLFPFLGVDAFYREVMFGESQEFGQPGPAIGQPEQITPGTYNLISAARASYEVSGLCQAWYALVQGGPQHTAQNNDLGLAATEALLSNLVQDTNEYFQQWYGLPDIELYQIGKHLPLSLPSVQSAYNLIKAPAYIVGKNTDDEEIDTGTLGEYVVHAGDGDDRILGWRGEGLVDGGRGNDTYDATTSEIALGINVTLDGGSFGTGEYEWIWTIQHGIYLRGPILLYDIENVKLTGAADYFKIRSLPTTDVPLTIDGGDGVVLTPVDVADLSDLDAGVTYDRGNIDGSSLKITGFERVILTNHNDTIKAVDPGIIVETGAGVDDIWFGGKDFAISDLSSDDRILIGGTQQLFGGVRNIQSNSIYATSWQGMFKYAYNAEGELLITSDVFGDVWVLNYGSASDAGPRPGGIYLYEYTVEVGRLIGEWSSHMSIMGVWEIFGALAKTHFGVSAWQGVDPLVLDLDGDGVELTTRSTASPRFDIDGDGYAERTGWVKSDDGILVRDLNANGKIDDVTEMFGNSTIGGFAALASLDRNGDGKVDVSDDIEDTNGNGVIDGAEAEIASGQRFADLKVWRDLNQNGKTDAGELFSLSELGITSLSVSSTATLETINGNQIVATGTFTRADGSTGTAADVVFSVDNIFTEYVGPAITIHAEALGLPDLRGQGTLVSLREALSLSAAARSAVAAALPTLDSLALADLRTAATPILTAWAEASPLADDDGNPATNPVKLKPHDAINILVRTDDLGRETVVDAAFQTKSTVSSEGGSILVQHWARASGSPIKDGSNNTIPNPTLAQVLADQTAPNEQWITLSGDLLSVVERLIGEELPLDMIQPEGTWQIPGLASLLSSALESLNSIVVRLLVQDGPLSSYFAGISYDVSINGFVGETDSELAPVYTAILSSMVANNESVDWLKSWRPILDLVVGDFQRGDGGLLNTYGFIAHNVVSAFEAVVPNISIETVTAAFGVPSDILVTGTGLVSGSGQADILYAKQANFTLVGGHGADEYVVGRHIGHSVIEDVEAPLQASFDILRLVSLNAEDVIATRIGTKLILTVVGTGETLEVLRQFEGEMPGLFGGDVSEDTGVNEIVFADGTVWNKFDIAEAVSHPDPESTILIGTDDNDYLDGGAGDDVLIGKGDGDIYVYSRGYGNDRIEDFEDYMLREVFDVLILKGLTPDDVEFLRDGSSLDVIVKIKDTGETLTIQDQFSATYTLIFGVQWFSRIEVITFADGTMMNADDVMSAVLADMSTSGDDVIYGFSREDRLDGGAGNDLLSGGNENDTYVFGIGSGHDTIWEQQENILSGGDDTVEFGHGLGVEDVIFERIGETDDLLVKLANHPDTLTIRGFYTITETGVFGPIAFDLIETFRWQDGTEKSWREIQLEVIQASQTDGDDLIIGTHFEETLNGGLGDDVIKGGSGDDTYIVEKNSGDDVIIDYWTNILAGGDQDRLVFGEGISRQSIWMERTGDELLNIKIDFGLDDGTVEIIDQFYYTSINYRPYEIEFFEFHDGLIWTAADLRQAYLEQFDRAANDVIEGFWSDDVLTGGAGNDILRGGDGSDIYRFDLNFGQDRIEEAVSIVSYDDYDTVEFGTGLTSDLAQITRAGNDLIINFAGLSDQLTVVDQFIHGAYFDGWWDVELFRFGDDVEWSPEYVREKILTQDSTSGDDLIVGFWGDDVIDGGAGNDTLRGLGGGDTYIFRIGSGHDVIEESIDSVYEDFDDTVFFDSSISPTQVTYSKHGFDLLITVDANNSVLVKDHFVSHGYHSVEFVRFADGTSLSASQIALLAVEEAPEEGSVTHLGTTGNDTLNGTSDDDVFRGAGGDDHLSGYAGNDTFIYASGDGNDTIEEGPEAGIDTLRFSDLNPTDVTFAREVDDLKITVHSTGHVITILAGLSEGFSDYSYGIERIVFADETVWNRSQIEHAAWFRGTSGDDVISGTVDDDTFLGNEGDDALSGESGSDTYVYASGDGNDTIEEGSDTGIDTLRFTDINPADVTLSRVVDDLKITVHSTGHVITILAGLSEGFSDYSYGIERIVFADETVWDRSQIESAAWIRGTSGDDVINGSYADDTIIGHEGDDTLYGSSGSDTYVYASGDGNDTIDESYDSGVDTLRFTDINPPDVTFSREGDDIKITVHLTGHIITILSGILEGYEDYSYGLERIVFADETVWDRSQIESAAWIRGTSGDDAIFGSYGSDIISGGAGNDYLEGSSGDDTYVYALGDGNDVIYEDYSSSLDVLKFTDLNSEDLTFARVGTDLSVTVNATGHTITVTDSLAGGNVGANDYGIEKIIFANGTSWNETQIRNAAWIRGTDGDDNITGSGQAETFYGGLGDDYLAGAGGNDTYVYALGDGNDVISEGNSTNGDTLRFTDLNASDLTFTRSGSDLKITVNATGHMISVTNNLSGAATTTNNSGIEQIVFADQTSWNETQIRAAAWIRGTAGNDQLTGTSGNDTIFGGSGNDTLKGNGGNDVFVFKPGFGHDVITDFSAGSGIGDIIEFSDSLFVDFSDVLASASQQGADTLVTLDSANSLLLKNVTMSSLDADDFRFVA